MSDMFLVAKQLVKGCQTLAMDPTSLLQQSLVNTVPHIVMVHTDIYTWLFLVSGQSSHLKQVKSMSLEMLDGSLAKNDKENAVVLGLISTKYSTINVK